jgi:HupE / UreJ protein.
LQPFGPEAQIMIDFKLYLEIGLLHILDVKGFDHILFVLALATIYSLHDWKRILILVTAFTIGHSITLALATLRLISVKTEWVEFIIPVTILVTAASNLFFKENRSQSQSIQLNYLYALFFGLIHGLGFSTLLRALLGNAQNIAAPLFAFNIGLEIGQIIIVALFLFLSFIVVDLLKVRQVIWVKALSTVIILMTLTLFRDRIFWM